MLDKLGIGIVGVVDCGTRLYNLGAGFAGMVGSIGFGKDDSMYLGFTAERAYVVTVEGDLVLSTETADAGHKVDGVYGFDVDWSDAAKARGFGVGTLFITNPDAPKNISMFTVRMDAAQSVSVKFDSETGANARAVLTDTTDIGKLDRSMARALAGEQPEVDSSALRRALAETGDANVAWADFGTRRRGAVPESVRRYVAEHGLYSDDAGNADLGRLRRQMLT